MIYNAALGATPGSHEPGGLDSGPGASISFSARDPSQRGCHAKTEKKLSPDNWKIGFTQAEIEAIETEGTVGNYARDQWLAKGKIAYEGEGPVTLFECVVLCTPEHANSKRAWTNLRRSLNRNMYQMSRTWNTIIVAYSFENTLDEMTLSAYRKITLLQIEHMCALVENFEEWSALPGPKISFTDFALQRLAPFVPIRLKCSTKDTSIDLLNAEKGKNNSGRKNGQALSGEEISFIQGCGTSYSQAEIRERFNQKYGHSVSIRTISKYQKA